MGLEDDGDVDEIVENTVWVSLLGIVASLWKIIGEWMGINRGVIHIGSIPTCTGQMMV